MAETRIIALQASVAPFSRTASAFPSIKKRRCRRRQARVFLPLGGFLVNLVANLRSLYPYPASRPVCPFCESPIFIQINRVPLRRPSQAQICFIHENLGKVSEFMHHIKAYSAPCVQEQCPDLLRSYKNFRYWHLKTKTPRINIEILGMFSFHSLDSRGKNVSDETTETHEYVGFWSRFGASIVDTILI